MENLNIAYFLGNWTRTHRKYKKKISEAQEEKNIKQFSELLQVLESWLLIFLELASWFSCLVFTNNFIIIKLNYINLLLINKGNKYSK